MPQATGPSTAKKWYWLIMQQSFTCSPTVENHQEGLLGMCRALPPLCSLPLFISQSQRLSLTNDQKMKARRLSGILEVWRPDSGYIFWNSNLSGVGSLYLDDSDILYSIVFCCEVLSWDRWTLGSLVNHWSPHPLWQEMFSDIIICGKHHPTCWETLVSWRKFLVKTSI